jgi:hypothetical protein
LTGPYSGSSSATGDNGPSTYGALLAFLVGGLLKMKAKLKENLTIELQYVGVVYLLFSSSVSLCGGVKDGVLNSLFFTFCPGLS